MSRPTRIQVEINGRDYQLDVAAGAAGFIYYDEAGDRVAFSTQENEAEVRGWYLLGAYPDEVARSRAVAVPRSIDGPAPRNRAERRRHLKLVRGEDH